MTILLLLAIIYTLWKPEPKTVVSLFSAFLSWAGKPYPVSGSRPWVQLRSFTMHGELWVLYNLMVTEFWLLSLVRRYSSCLLHKYMAHACACVHWHIHTNTQFLCLENKSLKYMLRIFIFPSYEPLNLTSKPRVSKLEPSKSGLLATSITSFIRNTLTFIPFHIAHDCFHYKGRVE